MLSGLYISTIWNHSKSGIQWECHEGVWENIVRERTEMMETGSLSNTLADFHLAYVE